MLKKILKTNYWGMKINEQMSKEHTHYLSNLHNAQISADYFHYQCLFQHHRLNLTAYAHS